MDYRFHLFKNKLPLYNRALDAYAMRQKTIAKNIANATSPHYTPEKVKFEEFFNESKAALAGSTDSEYHIPLGKPEREDAQGEIETREIPNPEIYHSGETHVNIDKEMMELAENQIRFKFASSMTKRYFDGINMAIRGSIA